MNSMLILLQVIYLQKDDNALNSRILPISLFIGAYHLIGGSHGSFGHRKRAFIIAC